MASVFDRIVAAPPGELKRVVRRPAVLAVALAVAGILAVHFETAASIVAIWLRSETFAHGFVVVPIVLWLVWRRRGALNASSARPWVPALAGVLLAGAAWLAATLAEVQVARQFGLAFMIEASIVAVVGLRIAREIAFPLAFLLFAVPFGEFMVPTMIDWTADFTIEALRASGVPVYREANHFVIPSGSWSVVEACSGIRYLIVSLMVGTLYAMVSYRSVRLRAAFIAASIVVPILANWLRAYGIVMLGHLSDNRIAVGVDHLIYGWLFFGVVMALLFWLGSRWHEPDAADAPLRTDVSPSPSAASPSRGVYAVALLAIAAAAIWPPLASWIDRSAPAGPVTLAPLAAAQRWAPVAVPFTSWKARYGGYAAELEQAFRSESGEDAGLYVAFYRDQAQGRELVTSGNALVVKADWKHKQVAARQVALEWAGTTADVRQVIIAGTNDRLQAVSFYWIDGRITASDFVAKLLLVWSMVRGRGDDAALVVLYAPVTSDDSTALASLRRFAAAVSPQVEQMLAAASQRTP